MVTLFGLDGLGLVVTCLAVVALALPLAMVDAKTDRTPTPRFVLTRRNLILCITVFVIVGTWYSERGLSLLPIGVLVLTLPLIIGLGRLGAARRQRLEFGMLRRPLRARLGPHLLQLANVALLCAMLALTIYAGAYNPVALQFSPGLHCVLLVAFMLGLVAFVLVALVPLRQVQLGSNLLVVPQRSSSLSSCLAVPAAGDPVTVASPLAGEWWVGHGGHTELVNYHHTDDPTPRPGHHAGRRREHPPPRQHQPDQLHIYDQPVLAPADGTMTYVVDGHPDLPIGTVDSQHPTGNQLVIDIGGGHYLMMGHLRQSSISVHVGEHVTRRPTDRPGRKVRLTHQPSPTFISKRRTLPTGIADLTTIDGSQRGQDPPHLPASVPRSQPHPRRRGDPTNGC